MAPTSPRCVVDFVLALLLCLSGASCRSWEPESRPWDLGQSGAVTAFDLDRLPPSESVYAYAVPDRPKEILVSLAPLHLAVYTSASSTPTRVHDYVVLADLAGGKIRLVPYSESQAFGPFGKAFPPEFLDSYSAIKPRGSTSSREMVYPFRTGEKEWLMVASSDSDTVSRWDFGVPSIIPFMGRKHFFESVPYHSGVVFLEIFDVSHPSEPVITFSKEFETWRTLPRLRDFASWVRGAERPVVVILDRQTPSPANRIIVKELLEP